ncbi:hypothetical protein GR268_46270 [Rhizobium leguminosarum]|nr:hypothetical protein [Rhizobium leguminosarum]
MKTKKLKKMKQKDVPQDSGKLIETIKPKGLFNDMNINNGSDGEDVSQPNEQLEVIPRQSEVHSKKPLVCACSNLLKQFAHTTHSPMQMILHCFLV